MTKPLASDAEAAAAGIDALNSIRQDLIDLRSSAMTVNPPPWHHILLLSHAIWWLAAAEETRKDT